MVTLFNNRFLIHSEHINDIFNRSDFFLEVPAKLYEIISWCDENGIVGYRTYSAKVNNNLGYNIEYYIDVFEEIDAVAFKLRWI